MHEQRSVSVVCVWRPVLHSAGVIFGQFSMGKLHDGTCEMPFLATRKAPRRPSTSSMDPLEGLGMHEQRSVSVVCVWRPVLTRPG